jgi:tRNA(fMet)-specific endonuclease VapC
VIRYLLDTNALIELIREGRSPVGIRARQHTVEEIGIPVLGLHELYFGAYKSSRVDESVGAVEDLIFPVVPFEREDARCAGEIRAVLRQAGLQIGHYDVLIAGQALARGLVMVTHHVREFGRVEGLRVEDWQGGDG